VVRLFTQHIAIIQIYSHGASLQKSRRVSAEKPTQPNQLDQTISLSLCLSRARARARSLPLSLSHTGAGGENTASGVLADIMELAHCAAPPS